MTAAGNIDLVPLRLLSVGQLARINCLVGRQEDVHRLDELGFRQGVEIEMVQPGSPCIVRFHGGKFCLRDDDSLGILVDVGNFE